MAPATPAPAGRLPGWLTAAGPLGVRWLDVGILAVVIGAIELNVLTGGGTGAAPLNAKAYLLGAVIAVPVLFRHRYPRQILILSVIVMFGYYSTDRRNISPAPLLGLPVYDAAVSGALALAIVVPSVIMVAGLIAETANGDEGTVLLAANYLPSIILFVLAVTLGEVVRSRRALATETTRRLQLAEEERAAEAALLVAEERLRIARELHDTVAHSMATITVQAGSALHLLKENQDNNELSAALGTALTAIRETSKSALAETRTVLGGLRGRPREPAAGLDRLAALRDAVAAAGTPVTVQVDGTPAGLPAEADHAAYRILQESLTNVLRHAGPGTAAAVRLRYSPGELTLSVTNTGPADPSGTGSGDAGGGGGSGGGGSGDTGSGGGAGSGGAGHGIDGMRERAAAVGGTVAAGPAPGGGFRVSATIPVPAAADEVASDRAASDRAAS